MAEKRHAEDVERALEKRYCQPEWAFFPQVRSSTGGAASIADGIAMHMYRSRGHEIHGFEIKVSRSDWLSELKQPDKAETIFSYCDRWWLIVSDKDIVKDGELPSTWGLLVMRDDGLLVQKVKAPLIKATVIDQAFVASLLRSAVYRMSKSVPRESIQKEISEARENGRKEQDYEIEREKKRADEYQGMITAFEKASGVKIDRWHGEGNAEKIGERVRKAIAGEQFNVGWQVDSAISSTERVLAELRGLKGLLPERSAHN